MKTTHVADHRFVQIAFLAHGGFSTIYEALDTRTQQWVALKVPRDRPQLDAAARLKREISIYQRLRTPHVPHFIAETTMGQRPAMALELLRGQTLARKLDRQPLSAAAAVEIARETLRALGSLHSIGMVHCDVNPSNVFMHWNADTVEVVKVLDFGISNSMGSKTRQTSEVVGTLPYMASEQLHGGRLSAATDTYAVGALLYLMLAGRLPFDSLSSRARPPLSLSVLRPSCTPELENIVLRALEEKVSHRFQTTAEMEHELAALVEKGDYPHGSLAIAQPSSVPPAATPIAGMMRTKPERGDDSSPPTHPRSGPVPPLRHVVLVVEDDRDLRRDLVYLLEREGYQVKQATNGEEALAILESRPPDVILTDLMMPIMDGWALRRRMLATPHLASIPVVVLSSAGGLSGEAARLRATAHLDKPIDPKEILSVISQTVERRP